MTPGAKIDHDKLDTNNILKQNEMNPKVPSEVKVAINKAVPIPASLAQLQTMGLALQETVAPQERNSLRSQRVEVASRSPSTTTASRPSAPPEAVVEVAAVVEEVTMEMRVQGPAVRTESRRSPIIRQVRRPGGESTRTTRLSPSRIGNLGTLTSTTAPPARRRSESGASDSERSSQLRTMALLGTAFLIMLKGSERRSCASMNWSN